MHLSCYAQFNDGLDEKAKQNKTPNQNQKKENTKFNKESRRNTDIKRTKKIKLNS